MLGLGVSLVIFGLVPILRVLGVPDRAVYTGAGLSLVAWFVLPDQHLAVRRAEGQLLDLHPWRAHDRDRRLLGADVQRRRSARPARLGRRALQRPRAGPADVDGLPAAKPLPDRGDARDVHARRLHPRRRRHDLGRVHERVQRPGHLRRRLRRAGHDLAGAADRAHALGPRADAGREAAGLQRRLERVLAARQGAPARDRRRRRSRTRSTVQTRPSSRTRPTAWPTVHTGTARTPRSGGRFARAPTWRSSTRRSSRERRTGASRCCRSSRSTASTSRTAPSTRCTCRSATPRPGKRMKLTVIGVLSDSAPQFMYGIWTSQRSLRPVVRRPRAADDPPVRDGAGRRPEGRARTSSRRSSAAACKPTRSRTRFTTWSPPT